MCIICDNSQDYKSASYNSIKKIDYVECPNITFLSRDNLPENLEYLGCTNCLNLKDIKDLPLKMVTLSVRKCPSLTVLSFDPESSLKTIKFYGCQNLYEILVLPRNLRFLDCSWTKIKTLPTQEDRESRVIDKTKALLKSTGKTDEEIEALDCQFKKDYKILQEELALINIYNKYDVEYDPSA